MSDVTATANVNLGIQSTITNTETDGSVSSNPNNVNNIVDLAMSSGVAANEINRSWERKSWTLPSGESEVVDLFDFDGIDIGAGAGNDGLGQALLCSNLATIEISVDSGAGTLEFEPDATHGFTPTGTHTVATGGGLKSGGAFHRHEPSATGLVISSRSSQRIKFTANGGDVTYSVRLGLRAAENLPSTLGGLDLWLRADIGASTGGARQFTAVNSEYLGIAIDAVSTDTQLGNFDFCLFGWVYLDSLTADRPIVSKWSTGGNAEVSLRYDNATGQFQVIYSTDGSAITTLQASSFGTVVAGEWHFVVFEHDSVGDTCSIQVNNGAINSQSNLGGIHDGSAPFRIGSEQSPAEYMDGRIARVGLVASTLSTAQRAALYNSGRGLVHADLPSDVSDDVRVYYDLDELSGNAQDATDFLNGVNVLFDNATVTAANGVVPRVRQYAAATSEYHSIADNAALSTGNVDFTISGWVYMNTIGADRTIAGKWGSSGSQEYRLQYNTTATRFRFSVSSLGADTISVDADALGIPVVSQWYYVVAWHNAAEHKIYIQVNGGAVNSAATTGVGVFDSAAAFNLGARAGGSDLLNGRLSRVGMWKRILSSNERDSLYNDGRGTWHSDLSDPMRVSLVGFWNLNEIDDSAIDSEGANDLTDNNTVTSVDAPFEATGTPALLSALDTGGAPIASWIDRSGNSKQFTQEAIAKRPTYQSETIGGQPAILFDGSDDLLTLSEDLLSGTEGTVIAVVQWPSSPPANMCVLGVGDEAAGNETLEFRARRDSTDPNASFRIDDNTTDNVVRGDTDLSDSTDYILVWASDGSSYSIRVNGAAELLTTISGSDNGNWFDDIANQDNVAIGAVKRVSESNHLDGSVAEVIVYDHNLSSAELALIESYLSTRYGITLAT